MNTLNKLLLTSTLAAALSLAGCGGASSPDGDSDHADHSGHDHGPGEHPGDDSGDAGGHDDHDAGRILGEIVINGTTLGVSVGGEVKPGATLHVDIRLAAGPAPSAIRLWIGDEAGTGALKSKADGHENHYHAGVEVPEPVDSGASLWIEVESADGERTARSLPLNN